MYILIINRNAMSLISYSMVYMLKKQQLHFNGTISKIFHPIGKIQKALAKLSLLPIIPPIQLIPLILLIPHHRFLLLFRKHTANSSHSISYRIPVFWLTIQKWRRKRYTIILLDQRRSLPITIILTIIPAIEIMKQLLRIATSTIAVRLTATAITVVLALVVRS